MCRSSTKIRKMRPEASLVGRGGGSRMPSCTGGGGAPMSLITRPPCVSTKVTSVLLYAVLEEFEVPLPEVGDELPRVVSDDHVSGHQIDAAADDVARLRDGREDPFGLRRVLRGWGFCADRPAAAPSES